VMCCSLRGFSVCLSVCIQTSTTTYMLQNCMLLYSCVTLFEDVVKWLAILSTKLVTNSIQGYYLLLKI